MNYKGQTIKEGVSAGRGGNKKVETKWAAWREIQINCEGGDDNGGG